MPPGRSFANGVGVVSDPVRRRNSVIPTAQRFCQNGSPKVAKRDDLRIMEWRTSWRIALFRESAWPPHPVEQGVWNASPVTAQDGGYIFAAAPSAATSDAATSTPRRSSSAARGFRILSPDHWSSQHLHRQTRYRQTGGSTCTGDHGSRPSRADGESVKDAG